MKIIIHFEIVFIERDEIMVSIENLEKELKNGNLEGIYLLYGEELFLLESSLKRIKGSFGELVKGINYILIDDTNIGELISDIETPAFGFEKKLIIARNTNLFAREGKRKNAEVAKMKEKLTEYLQENEKLIKQSVVLVFVEDTADSVQKLYKTIDKIGVVCKFDYQKPLEIAKRIKGICNGYKVLIDDNTIRYFIEVCGTNMQDLINEIRKLIEYAGPNGKIQKEDIDKLSIKKLESIVNELESGEVALDDAINKYTEAMKLSKECSDKLTEVTEKVNKILADNGKLEDFEVKE